MSNPTSAIPSRRSRRVNAAATKEKDNLWDFILGIFSWVAWVLVYWAFFFGSLDFVMNRLGFANLPMGTKVGVVIVWIIISALSTGFLYRCLKGFKSWAKTVEMPWEK